jgi:hypothetical protein
MPEQTPHQGRRQHFHRGRRGPDRRGGERRTTQFTPDTSSREHVDVEQIMRDIRARISQRHGIELSNQQIQELAARRLEAILEPRNIKPALLEQLRKNAGDTTDIAVPASDGGFAFEESTLYDTHRGLLRFIRKLLNPILKLLFNPTPLIDALHTQARLNAEAATREAERDRRQAEWNALHFEILQRMVTDVSRVSLDMQALLMRVESLSAKVDFNERRVRGLENTNPQGRPQTPRQAPAAPDVTATPPSSPSEGATLGDTGTAEGAADAPRRRRRRRRGRRGTAGPGETQPAAEGGSVGVDTDEGDLIDGGDNGEDEIESTAGEPQAAVSLEPAHTISPLQPLEPHAPAVEPVRPEPPRDEPTPPTPTDHAEPGPPDR